MKNMTIGEVLFLIVGFVAVTFLIAWFFPQLTSYFKDAESKKPTLPSYSYVAPTFEKLEVPTSKKELIITLPNQAA